MFLKIAVCYMKSYKSQRAKKLGLSDAFSFGNHYDFLLLYCFNNYIDFLFILFGNYLSRAHFISLRAANTEAD